MNGCTRAAVPTKHTSSVCYAFKLSVFSWKETGKVQAFPWCENHSFSPSDAAVTARTVWQWPQAFPVKFMQLWAATNSLQVCPRRSANSSCQCRDFPRKTWWNSTIVLIIPVFPRCKMTRGKFHYQILGCDNFYILTFSCFLFVFF